MRSFIEGELALWEAPGCAVTAIRAGQVILCDGFGVRDLESRAPVTQATLFPIGSTTKAFTAAAVGALVDDSIIEWERPVRDYIPGFALSDPAATERVTPLDLLCHRTGLPRHEFAWMGHPDRSRADLVRRLRYLPLNKGLRQEFQYSNLGFIAAGHLVEAVTGTSWEEFVTSRLLKPLGMDRTNFSVSELLRADDAAIPHDRRAGTVVEIPFRPIDEVGPAGGINSSAADMLRWLRLHLEKGRLGEVQAISPATIARMHRPQMVMGEDTTFPESTRFAYGLGWMIGQYRGRRVVDHKGGVDGFLTECMLLPDEGIGVVVLTNSMAGSVGAVVAFRVIDELLGLAPIDWSARLKAQYDALTGGQKRAQSERPRVDGAAPLRPYEAYAGDYEHPGYGTIRLTVEEGRLIPAFGTLRLSMSHRHYDVFDLEWHEMADEMNVFPLTFLTGPEGDVVALTVPFEPLVEPIRFDRLPDAQARDPKILARLAGTYVMGPIEILVEVKAARTLTITSAGVPAAGLAPVRGLRFAVAGQPGVSVEFILAVDGTVEKVIVQPVGVFEPKR